MLEARSITMKYRRDVDGLRAIAILLVVLFHADWGFQGGFVGVDVFFVISGYLITGKILQDLEEGQFRLKEFWLRRVRRIAPAATCTVLLSLLPGFLLLIPNDLLGLSRSAVYQQLMITNVFFWRWTGYFDGTSDLKPLLHMWSLAVEEQFYLVFPVVLAFVYRKWKAAVFPLIITTTVVSIVISQWLLTDHGSFVFYMLPTRAWEFLLGSLIWWFPSPTVFKYERFRGLFSVLCIVGVTTAGWFYRDYFPFPGLSALLPCVATMLLIWGNDDRSTWVGCVLKSTVMVGLGRLSYSWYLTHWPTLAFARYIYGLELSGIITILAIVIGFVLAIVLFFVVEEPFRRGRFRQLPSTQLVCAVISIGILIAAFDVGIVASSGAMFRYPAHVQKMIAESRKIELMKYDESLFRAGSGMLAGVGVKEELGAEDQIDFLVWGDSHGTVLAELLDSLAKRRGLAGVLASKSGVGPFPGYRRELGKVWNAKVLDLVIERNVKKVLLVARWNGELLGNGLGERDALQSLVTRLCDRSVHVSVMMQVPDQKFDPRYAWIRAASNRIELPSGRSLEEYRTGMAPLNDFFQGLENLGAHLISIEECCFDSQGLSRLGSQDSCYYWDDDHLSPEGVEVLLGPVLAKWMDQG